MTAEDLEEIKQELANLENQSGLVEHPGETFGLFFVTKEARDFAAKAPGRIAALVAKVERLRVLRSLFYDLNESFEEGEQPCKDFKPHREKNGYGEWDNRHECPGCCGLRSFCLSCSTDHHSRGWDCCATKKAKSLRAALIEERANIRIGRLRLTGETKEERLVAAELELKEEGKL
jgi:hypothetical protein